MPIFQQMIPTQGREFWDSLDLNNNRQVLEAAKEEFDRLEPDIRASLLLEWT
jgi:hypothetical protein